MWRHGTITAQGVASTFAAASQEFAECFFAQVASAHADEVSIQEHWRTEACAAVWAAISATLDATNFSDEERAVLVPLVMQYMVPFWLKHCGCESDVSQMLTDRASRYLRNRQQGNLMKTAASIVSDLMEAAGTSRESRPKTGRLLTTTLAHRMLSDLQRLDDIAAQRARQ